MALSITQLAAPVEGAGVTSLASSSFSPSANALVIVQATVTGNSGANGAMTLATDFGSLSFTKLGQYGATNNGSSNVAIWYAQVGGSAPGSGTVTVTYSGNIASGRIAVAEVTGHNQTTPIVGTNGTNNSGVDTISTTLTSSPTTGDMVIGGVVTRNLNGAGTVGSGFTALWWGFDAAPSATTGLEYQTGTTSTTVDFSALNTVSSALIGFIVQVDTGGGTNANVDAVAATATTQGEAPSVSAGSVVTSVVAAATTQAEAPSVSAGSTVTAVAATATAQAEAPSVAGGVSGNANVDAVEATATSEALAPTITAGATVTAIEATATAQAEVPTVDSGGTDVQVAVEVATANSMAQTPGVSVVTYTLTLATSNYPAGKDLLWGHVFYKPGTSIVKKNGVYTQKRFPNVDGAEVIYLGGRVYTIPLSEYDALTAAGFSSLLTATEVTY